MLQSNTQRPQEAELTLRMAEMSFLAFEARSVIAALIFSSADFDSQVVNWVRHAEGVLPDPERRLPFDARLYRAGVLSAVLHLRVTFRAGSLSVAGFLVPRLDRFTPFTASHVRFQVLGADASNLQLSSHC